MKKFFLINIFLLTAALTACMPDHKYKYYVTPLPSSSLPLPKPSITKILSFTEYGAPKQFKSIQKDAYVKFVEITNQSQWNEMFDRALLEENEIALDFEKHRYLLFTYPTKGQSDFYDMVIRRDEKVIVFYFYSSSLGYFQPAWNKFQLIELD